MNLYISIFSFFISLYVNLDSIFSYCLLSSIKINTQSHSTTCHWNGHTIHHQIISNLKEREKFYFKQSLKAKQIQSDYVHNFLDRYRIYCLFVIYCQIIITINRKTTIIHYCNIVQNLFSIKQLTYVIVYTCIFILHNFSPLYISIFLNCYYCKFYCSNFECKCTLYCMSKFVNKVTMMTHILTHEIMCIFFCTIRECCAIFELFKYSLLNECHVHECLNIELICKRPTTYKNISDIHVVNYTHIYHVIDFDLGQKQVMIPVYKNRMEIPQLSENNIKQTYQSYENLE